ncbi:MOSC N-terminal beta barrel domain-containing protein [Natronolimnohabitans sp. A-GB9]|uniref:MOSC domain-containing protein n=1 Tax=Natronolimnohabitans sp. A-GB9 TaxID=3069757 RepID=UPI0027AF2EB1|nr:MOSC N-terminal beta barrel domain-containing protein [Natronolimnohabitans sp. A-GB9]MDQ2050185.1 MOSC N-terminal beta barrel domain-containing protein [Natronolimnohabitans sp. A-GB9]
MPRLDRLRVYPVKSLNGIDLEAADVLDGGTLAHDREFALFDRDALRSTADGTDPDPADSDVVINGKRTARVHDLRTDFDPETGVLVVEPTDGETASFDLESAAGRDRAASWFGEFFDEDVSLERNRTCGYVDRPGTGPSVISTATLETVADWFDDVTVEGARRRLRPNLEISGVEPFWEDRFVGADAPAFEIGGVRLEGVTPCNRCVVPERDPDTGDATPQFRERFVEKRRETFPDWADEDAFDHYYATMLIARVPESDRGKTVRSGDPVDVVDS